MSMKLSDADIIRLLPVFMQGDEANIALGAAVNNLIRGPGSRAKQLRVWDTIDELDHEQLDELAWELNIDWYSSALELQRKRDTIKISDQVHAKRGTKWAVEQLISAYFGPGYVREWFEYDGNPFTFIVMTTNKYITDATFQEFVRIANAAISVRSHLEGIFYYGEYGAEIIAGRNIQSTAFNLTKCGTKHRAAYVGKIMEHRVEAGQTITGQSFNFSKAGTKKAGTFPGAAITGKALTPGSAIASSIIEGQSFAFIKCGTRKTMS